MKRIHLFTKIFACIILSFILTQNLFAKLPEKSEIAGLPLDSLRASGRDNLQKYDTDTEQMFHPYFTESINAILKFYKINYGLPKKINENGQETTANYYLTPLAEKNIKIYKMKNLQGRVLRVLINQQIPVFGITRWEVTKQNLHIVRMQGTVIYLYREPNFTQSSRLVPGEKKYEFKSAFGTTFIFNDIETIKSTTPYEFYCVLTSPDMPLKTIQKQINDGLSDVGFEYKLPDFEPLEGSNISW